MPRTSRSVVISERCVRPGAARRLSAMASASLWGVALLVCLFTSLAGCAADVNPAQPGPVDADVSAAPKLSAKGAPQASSAPSAAAVPVRADASGNGATPQSYVIQPGDQIEVRFLYHPYFNATAPVRPDGKITLQMVHDVQAAGLTPMQLWYYLTKRYEQLLDREDITVTLKSFAAAGKGQSIYVGGEVALPKMLEMTPGMTVVQALYEAGGIRDTGNTESILVLRRLYASDHQVLSVNVEQVLEGRAPDLTLEDRDVIYVPKTFIAQANVYVDQYLNRIVPRWVTSAFAFTYPIGKVETQTQVISAPN